MTARRLQTRCNSNRIGRTWRRSHVPRRLNALVSGNPCTDLQEGTREGKTDHGSRAPPASMSMLERDHIQRWGRWGISYDAHVADGDDKIR